MKLKVFNSTNIKSFNNKEKKPFIQVNNKVGLFNINQSAAKLLDLKDRDMVQLLQDEENPEDWFIEKVKEDGFIVRDKNPGHGFVFNKSHLSKLIFESVKCEMMSGRMLIGDEVKGLKGRKVYSLITASLNAYRGEK